MFRKIFDLLSEFFKKHSLKLDFFFKTIFLLVLVHFMIIYFYKSIWLTVFLIFYILYTLCFTIYQIEQLNFQKILEKFYNFLSINCFIVFCCIFYELQSKTSFIFKSVLTYYNFFFFLASVLMVFTFYYSILKWLVKSFMFSRTFISFLNVNPVFKTLVALFFIMIFLITSLFIYSLFKDFFNEMFIFLQKNCISFVGFIHSFFIKIITVTVNAINYIFDLISYIFGLIGYILKKIGNVILPILEFFLTKLFSVILWFFVNFIHYFTLALIFLKSIIYNFFLLIYLAFNLLLPYIQYVNSMYNIFFFIITDTISFLVYYIKDLWEVYISFALSEARDKIYYFSQKMSFYLYYYYSNYNLYLIYKYWEAYSYLLGLFNYYLVDYTFFYYAKIIIGYLVELIIRVIVEEPYHMYEFLESIVYVTAFFFDKLIRILTDFLFSLPGWLYENIEFYIKKFYIFLHINLINKDGLLVYIYKYIYSIYYNIFIDPLSTTLEDIMDYIPFNVKLILYALIYPWIELYEALKDPNIFGPKIFKHSFLVYYMEFFFPIYHKYDLFFEFLYNFFIDFFNYDLYYLMQWTLDEVEIKILNDLAEEHKVIIEDFSIYFHFSYPDNLGGSFEDWWFVSDLSHLLDMDYDDNNEKNSNIDNKSDPDDLVLVEPTDDEGSESVNENESDSENSNDNSLGEYSNYRVILDEESLVKQISIIEFPEIDSFKESFKIEAELEILNKELEVDILYSNNEIEKFFKEISFNLFEELIEDNFKFKEPEITNIQYFGGETWCDTGNFYEKNKYRLEIIERELWLSFRIYLELNYKDGSFFSSRWSTASPVINDRIHIGIGVHDKEAAKIRVIENRIREIWNFESGCYEYEKDYLLNDYSYDYPSDRRLRFLNAVLLRTKWMNIVHKLDDKNFGWHSWCLDMMNWYGTSLHSKRRLASRLELKKKLKEYGMEIFKDLD